MSDTRTANLVRYVPRQAAEWDIRNPDDLWIGLEGTLVYVDISGFTALSEKLAARGKVGAEELTEALNYVFGEMLTVAYARGGRLLKFGGDALLLLFQTEDHPVQACSAAVEMQQALRGASSYRTSAGRLNLKMSVGVHSGTIHLFRVGTSHKELILTGPAASKTTEMEETATAGEILISGETRAAIGDAAAPKPKGEGWLLGWRKGRGEGPGWTERLEVSPETLAQSVPGALRSHLSHGLTEPEHRIGTIGFVRFQGVDSMMDQHGPDAVAAALHELVAAVQGACEQEHVTFLASDIDANGGKIILTAGVPSTQEDDEGRMLRAVVDVRDSAPPFELQIGVNRGYVFAGDVGTEYRSTYTVMGDPVNLAARLMAASSPGEIYATAEVLEQSHTMFATTPLKPFHVKGKERPVQAYSVGEELGERAEAVHDDMPFRGRQEELERLLTAHQQAAAGSGAVVGVHGDRGIGKTRLVEELLRAVDAESVFSLRAEPYGTSTAYRAVRDPLRQLLGVVRGDPELMAKQARVAVEELQPDLLPLLPLLGDLLAIDFPATPEAEVIEPRFRRDRAADVVVALFDAIYRNGPLVLLAEDTHWLDEATGHLLERLSAAAGERPWLVVGTRRDVEGGFTVAGDRLDLHPLPDRVAKALIVEVTESAPLRPHEIDQIVARAGGNPLFLEEILTAVRVTGSVGELPETLDAVVSAQIDALPPLPRLLLRIASVLGRSFTPSVLAELVREMGIEPDRAADEMLAEFLEPDGTGRLVFRHALVRDAAYEGLSFKRRRELHRIAGNAIERVVGRDKEGVAGPLAIHYFRGQDWEKAWHYCRLAGDLAKEAYANVEAAEHYEKALDAVRYLDSVDPSRRVQLWTTLGDVREEAGLFEASLEAFTRAGRIAGGDVVRADLHLRKARARARAGAYSSALRETTRGLRALDHSRTRAARALRAGLTGFRAVIKATQQRPEDALVLAQSAARLADSVGEKEALARAYEVMDWAYQMLGQPEKATRGATSRRLREEIGDLTGAALVINNMGASAYFAGRWDEAVGLYRQARDAQLRAGNVVQAANSDANIAEVLIDQGRLVEAEPIVQEAVRVLRASNFRDAALFAELQDARLLTRKGEAGQAVEVAQSVREEAKAIGHLGFVVQAAQCLAEAHVAEGSGHAALAALDSGEEEGGEAVAFFAPGLARTRAAALQLLGDDQAAGEVLTEGRQQAEEMGLPFEAALLAIAEADLSRSVGDATDQAALDEAHRVLAGLGVREASTELAF